MKKNPHTRMIMKFLTDSVICYKKQWASAGMALVLGAGSIGLSFLYQPDIKESSTEESVPAVETFTAAETTATQAETLADTAWTPVLTELNLAHYFPEGEDEADITKSLAGRAFHELMTRDADWSSALYSYSDITPADMAVKLGLPKSRVTGKYNPEDSRHQKDDPSTWTIGSFRNVRFQAVDGDGNVISPYSNVAQIMSMANVYTYYHDPQDCDAFLAYAKALWTASHSFTMSVSDVYYCSGCIGKSAEEEEQKALEAEAEAEKQDQNLELPYDAEIQNVETAAGTASAQVSSGVVTAGIATAEKKAEEANRAESIAESRAAETKAAVPESKSGVIASRRGLASASNAEAETQAASHTDSTSAAETAVETIASEVSVEAQAETASAAAEKATSTDMAAGNASAEKTACPGHVDLTVTMKIGGLSDAAGLFALDAAGNNAEAFEDGGWQGWTEENRQAAIALASEDWYEKYGLSVSSISTGTPLTAAEIEEYLDALPEDISDTRKELLRFALNSVGKVPYYWGGKPAAKNYEGNHFGTLVSPDVDGRTLRGLDCSGWISWVYWSVTGTHLPYESTSGLAALGQRVSREDLKPGDILIRTGADAHVIMFLGWTSDGRVRCIHETSGSVNNVTVGERNAGWPYYRRLID